VEIHLVLQAEGEALGGASAESCQCGATIMSETRGFLSAPGVPWLWASSIPPVGCQGGAYGTAVPGLDAPPLTGGLPPFSGERPRVADFP